MWVVTLFGLEGALAFLLAFSFRRRAVQMLSHLRGELEAKEGSVRKKREELTQKKEENTLLGRRVAELIELYESTKEASASLKFQEVFMILRQVFHSNFSFEKGYLFLPQEETRSQGPQRIDEIYSVSRDGTPVRVDPKEIPYLEEILERSEKKGGAFQGNSFPFVAVPLWVKDQLISILACEKLQPEDLEKFTILSRQFALAIQKVKLYEKLQELSITDGLTRLYVRRYFLERFREELERSKRYTLHLSFLMADIDHFKQRNDHYGHLVGDVLLREVATLLKANVREIDLVGRYGGEEFSIALPDTRLAEALQVAERIRKAVEGKMFEAYDETIRLTLSIGVGAYPEDGKEPMGLIEAADTALYEAKQSGRNKVVSTASVSDPQGGKSDVEV
ncbi:MAG: sensor domain-containing diguanylate cyclase [Candidatus Omnitrophica bacterium]|nr:sensor domain-containing diguanylate cyclase [Candidatus Omnitrophota bacterium]